MNCGALGVLVLYGAVGVGCAGAALATGRRLSDGILLLVLWPLCGPFLLVAGGQSDSQPDTSVPKQLTQLKVAVAGELARGAADYVRTTRYRDELIQLDGLLRKLNNETDESRNAGDVASRGLLAELSRRAQALERLSRGDEN